MEDVGYIARNDLLEDLELLWENYPELRFGELISLVYKNVGLGFDYASTGDWHQAIVVALKESI